MGKKAEVYCNAELAGILEKTNEGEYLFIYDDDYFENSSKNAISSTLPKSTKIYRSKYLFPFFFGLLSEGDNKQVQCRLLRIDEQDHFTHLLKTARTDTIGAVTVREIQNEL